VATNTSTSSNNADKLFSLPYVDYGHPSRDIPELTINEVVPPAWFNSGAIQLQVFSANTTHYGSAASSTHDRNSRKILGYPSGLTVSGGSGPFTGTLLGVFATCNGAGTGIECAEHDEAFFGRWRYHGIAQYIEADELVPEFASLAQ
jgi:hypothetical protein